MGALRRMADVVRAEVNEVLNNLEDPKKMVRQMILDMEADVDDAVAAVAQAVAHEKLLERRIVQKREDSAQWARKAEAAFKTGEEDLARKALFQKAAVDEVVDALKHAREEAREMTPTLKQRLADLKAKLAVARAQQGVLVVRKRAAQARRGDVAAFDTPARAASRYDQFVQDTARDEVVAEVYAEMMGGDDLQLKEEFDRLARKQRVEAEMQALKEKTKPRAHPNRESDQGE